MNADDLNRELLLTMSRNFTALLEGMGVKPGDHAALDARDVRLMLRSIAANIAQAYAHRVSDNEDALMPNDCASHTGNPGRS